MLRERGVQARALARERLVVGHFLEQGMAEGEGVRVGHQHVMKGRLANRLAELRLGEVDRVRQHVVMNAAAAHRRGASHRLSRRVERPDARQEHVAQRCRQLFGALRPGRRDELLREQRVARRAREHRLDETRVGSVLEDPLQLGAELVPAEPLELDALGDRPAAGLGDEVAQIRPAIELVTAEGQHQHQPLVTQPPEQERQQIERRSVGPVHVVDGEQDRARGRRRAQRLEHRHEHRDSRRAAPRGVLELGRRAGGQRTERAQRLGDRQQGHVGVAQIRTAAEEDLRARVVRVRGELREQPRLADARLAAHEHRGRGAADGAIVGRSQLSQLALAPRDDLAREPARHGRSMPAPRTVWEEIRHTAPASAGRRLPTAQRPQRVGDRQHLLVGQRAQQGVRDPVRAAA
jgi:hypothetical protein